MDLDLNYNHANRLYKIMFYITFFFFFLKELFQLQTKQEKAGSSKPWTITKTIQHFT